MPTWCAIVTRTSSHEKRARKVQKITFTDLTVRSLPEGTHFDAKLASFGIRVNFHRNGTPVLRRKGTPRLSMIGADVAGREAGLGSNDHGCPGPGPRAGVKAREATRIAGLALTPSTDQARIRVNL
jgi:hypothetical protein